MTEDRGGGTAEVLAGGGVVLRGAGGEVEVLVVHRPRYDDWSLPKGKADSGESPRAAALREVEEETGVRCRVLASVGEVAYRDRHGRAKRVLYWLMSPVAGAVEDRLPDREIDQACWLALGEARRRLTYQRDRELLTTAAAQAQRRATT